MFCFCYSFNNLILFYFVHAFFFSLFLVCFVFLCVCVFTCVCVLYVSPFSFFCCLPCGESTRHWDIINRIVHLSPRQTSGRFPTKYSRVSTAWWATIDRHPAGWFVSLLHTGRNKLALPRVVYRWTNPLYGLWSVVFLFNPWFFFFFLIAATTSATSQPVFFCCLCVG